MAKASARRSGCRCAVARFPVLPAYVYVNSLVDSLGIGIPQNWIIDGKGVWRWQQIGYDPTTKDWVGDMLRKLDAAAEQ